MPSESPILVDSIGSVRRLVLNAPSRLNALDWPMVDALREAVSEISRDPECRAVVVTGAGRGFCAGADPKSLFNNLQRPVAEIESELTRVYDSFLGIRDLGVPTIAAVHGPAIGAGLGIALACDIVVGGPNASLGATFAAIGLHPGGGCSWLLNRRLGPARTTALLLDARVVDLDEAIMLGLVDRRAQDAKAEALALGERLAARDRTTLVDIVESVQMASDSNFEASRRREARAQAKSTQRPAFASFLAEFNSPQRAPSNTQPEATRTGTDHG